MNERAFRTHASTAMDAGEPRRAGRAATSAMGRARSIGQSAFAALVVAVIAGCTVGPDYVRPEVDAPDSWRIEFSGAMEAANTTWWEQFGDPVLDELIATALRNNYDVRIAAARVDQFIGALGSTRSQLFPQLGYGADASSNQASREGFPPVPSPADRTFDLYQAALGASWQVDLFGRVRRLSEAAQARVYATEQARRGVVLSLVTSVATSYITLRGLDRQREIAVVTARNFGESLRVFESRFEAGVVSMSEVVQVRSQYKQALAAIPAIDLQVAAVENLIALLLGDHSREIARGKSIDDLIAPAIPAGLPAELLQRRPDILQAEQNLVAANANVGAARALYYPTISLTGLLGSVSTQTGEFLTGSASTWSVGASVAGPIFTAGSIRGQVRSAEAQYEQAVLGYQQAILNAVRETNNALVGSQQRAEEVSLQRERVEALREFARLAKLKFDAGVVGYLEVLVAENERFAAELATARIQADRYIQVVNIYQAMGGGWVDLADSMTTP